MTTNAVQIRMPPVLLKNIEDLVKQGFYKNKSEAIIDAVRHFVGFGQTKSDIAIFIREELHGRFGTDADSVMKKIIR